MFVCYSLWNLDIWKLLVLVFVIDDVQRSVFLFLAIFQKKCDFKAVQRSALCSSRQELSNDYLLAKFGFDTAENESSKIWPRPVRREFRSAGRRPSASGARVDPLVDFRRLPPGLRQLRSSIGPKCCSFSAVSAPIFARKYAFCSIFQNLPDYLADILEIWQNFATFATFAIFLLNFHKTCWFFKPIFCKKIVRLQRRKSMQIL